MKDHPSRGEKIRALRLHLELNQEDFAELIGVRQAAISGYENGAPLKKHVMKNLVKLSKEVGKPITLEELMEDDR